MTVHPNHRDWDRLDMLVDEDPIALRDTAWRLTTALAAADHRADEAEAREEQLLLRNRNLLDAHRQAEARIKAVRDVLDGADRGGVIVAPVAVIRRALDGPPDHA